MNAGQKIPWKNAQMNSQNSSARWKKNTQAPMMPSP